MLERLSNISLPITDPTWVFTIVLGIILISPIIFPRLHIPHLIGMLIIGVLIGEHGFNVLERNDGFELLGQVGIYYIMFLAGLEMDLGGLKKNRKEGVLFGILTATIPFALGYLAGILLLHYSQAAALLLACIFASHTLVAYPIVGRYGLSKHKSVQISVIGTMVALLIALVVLAAVAGGIKDNTDFFFWLRLVAKFVIFLIALFFILPKIIRIFFRKVSEPVMQYTFVLTMMFVSAVVADACGLEGILGAFLSGLVFNRFIPHSGPLMNRVEFVGNAIFIPFFLIGVGMIVDIKPLFNSWTAVEVVLIMVVAGTLSKFLAAFCSRKMFKMTHASGQMMFGLTEAHAAGALAMVMVGTKLGLINEDVMDGVVVMILCSCIISSIATDHASKKLKLEVETEATKDPLPRNDDEKIMVGIHEPTNITALVSTAILMRNQKLNRGIICLNVVNDDDQTGQWQQHSRECLAQAAKICAAADVGVQTQSRLAVNFVNGIIHAFRENDASEMVIGLHCKRTSNDTLLGRFTEKLVEGLNRQITIVNYTMPVNTFRRIVVAIPEQAEYESGFYRWVERLARLATEVGCRIDFHGTELTCNLIRSYMQQYHKTVRTDYKLFAFKDGLEQLAEVVNTDHLLVIISARHGTISYQSNINKLQPILGKHFQNRSLMIIYPDQSGEETEIASFFDPHGHEKQENSIISRWLSKWINKTS